MFGSGFVEVVRLTFDFYYLVASSRASVIALSCAYKVLSSRMSGRSSRCFALILADLSFAQMPFLAAGLSSMWPMIERSFMALSI